MKNTASRHLQRGAVIVTAALLLLFLLGFMGIALDFGRLFVVRGELQTAMDSCALAAAGELDGEGGTTNDAITRAKSAGREAGNLNRVNLQSPNWSGQGKIVFGDITFLDKDYVSTIDPTVARYARCEHQQANIQIWLLKILNSFSAGFGAPTTGTVASFAVATRASAQSACPIPVAYLPKEGKTLEKGEWVQLLSDTAENGYIGWANLDSSESASNTRAQLEKGVCGISAGSIGTHGTKASVDEVWNTRFGIYKKVDDEKDGVTVNRPDYTGYPYTSVTWPPGKDAYDDFVSKRAAFASCADTFGHCEDALGTDPTSGKARKLGGKDLASSGATGQHHLYGQDRRIVLVPVLKDAAFPSPVNGFMCMLMLHPLSNPPGDAFLEYLGDASDPKSPCTTSGLAGGSAGPLVPVLVR